MLPAQMASSCCTTNGCAKNRFDCALIAISRVEMRAARAWGLFFCERSQLGLGVTCPLPSATSPCKGKKSYERASGDNDQRETLNKAAPCIPIYFMLVYYAQEFAMFLHTSSRVLYSLSSLIARSSHTIALVLLAPLLPGFICTSLLNCRQFAISAYKVAREKCDVRMTC